MLKVSRLSFFYVIGKGLSGELSWTPTGLVFAENMREVEGKSIHLLKYTQKSITYSYCYVMQT